VKKVCSTILTQNQRSKAQKPAKKQARIKPSASKIMETVFWCTEGHTGINHRHFLNLDTEKIVTCTLQQVPNEETHHLSA
jgi:hypothetical protein